MRLRAAAPALATVVAQTVELVAQLAAGVLVARLLGAAALGTWSLALGIVGTAALLLQPGTTDVVLQLAARGVAPGALLSTGLRRLPAGVVRVIPAVVVAASVAGADATAAMAVGLATLTLILNAVAALLGALVVADCRSVADLPGLIVSRVFFVVGVAAGAALGSLGLALAAGTVSALLLVAWRWVSGRPRIGALVIDRTVDVQVAGVARRLGAGIAVSALSARADLVVLHRLASPVELGWYAAGARLIAGALAMAQAVALALHPTLVRRRARGDVHAWPLFIAPAAVIVAGLLACAGLSLSPWILTSVFGDGFRAAAPVVDVLLVVGAVQVANTFLARALLVRDRGGALAPAQLGLALLSPALQWSASSSWGALGSARALLIVEILLLGASILALARRR
jgi:O-antigen/teichoic acid export membrane protein